MNAKVQRWADVVRLRSRYRRSVHLERDAQVQSALDGYVLTPLVRTLTGRIVDGYAAPSPARAWSITGPYGTGKSAFALFLADVVSPSELDPSKVARKLLAKADPALHSALLGPRGLFSPQDGLWPVLATGERKPLTQVLLRALRDSVEWFWGGSGAKPAIVHEVRRAAKKADSGYAISSRDAVAMFEETARKVAASNLPGRGLMVILDEAGKTLEHAAHHPDVGDVQLLQELAEASNRSEGAPIVFVVLLHQAFEQYAGRLSLTERSEWAKVQGRFQDLAFQEASHEVLRLIGEALGRGDLPKGTTGELQDVVHEAVARLSLGKGDGERFQHLLGAALPLHPYTALLLGPLFRSRIAQNERSLFAFLGSNEPCGFQEFLQQPIAVNGATVLFQPDQLYDYVTASLGGRLDGHLGKQWAQIETALRRLPEGATAVDAKIVKTIGMLGLFGDAANVPASDAVIRMLYGGSDKESGQSLFNALERLRAASLIVYRKYRGAYQLWEGSDLDVDLLVRDALSQVDGATTLVQRLTRVAPPRPIVARRHLLETGTFRYFDVQYVDACAFDEGFPDSDRHADGSIFLVIESSEGARKNLVAQLRQSVRAVGKSGDAKPSLVGVPRHVGRLLQVGAELAALEWVQTHTPELQDDVVARREVVGRMTEAERLLRLELGRLFGNECEWFHNGQEQTVESHRDLTRVVSELCARVYRHAPVVHNELLNRRQLSSAAAAARRSLLEAMVTRGTQERLGFEGTPPEVSMYRSVLEHHGVHRKLDERWTFGPPVNKRIGSLRPVWDAMDRALRDAHEARMSVPVLFERLRRPPYGLKDGLLPVLLVAATLSWSDEMALYEEGAFVPALTGAVVERILRQPDRFEVQRLTITGPRAALYGRLMQTLTSGAKGTAGLVPLVRQLVRVVGELPLYSRITKAMSPKAHGVREVLLRAREPAPLVFRDLPAACGLTAFEANGKVAERDVEQYVEELRTAMRELQFAYPNLLDGIEAGVQEAFALPQDRSAMRREVAARSEQLLPLAVDAQLKSFLLRAADADMPREEWIVSLGTLFGGKPPESWHDRDSEQAQMTIRLLAQRFASLESMVVSLGGPKNANGAPMLRVTVTQPGYAEHERTVPLRPADDALVQAVCVQLRGVAESAAASLPREAVLAALGLVTRDIIADLSPTPAPRPEADA